MFQRKLSNLLKNGSRFFSYQLQQNHLKEKLPIGKKNAKKLPLKLVGGIPTHLKNMSSSVGVTIPNIWKNNPFMFQSTFHWNLSFLAFPVQETSWKRHAPCRARWKDQWSTAAGRQMRQVTSRHQPWIASPGIRKISWIGTIGSIQLKGNDGFSCGKRWMP